MDKLLHVIQLVVVLCPKGNIKMKAWLHDKCSAIFFLTLVIYLITLFTVSYVGVYLTYVAVPTIIITGFIAYVTMPKET
ncbi:hypothetical protein AYI74_20530 [Shewanella algae]|nr:hypothetical protein AYI74_20530 [Shewanella algae]